MFKKNPSSTPSKHKIIKSQKNGSPKDLSQKSLSKNLPMLLKPVEKEKTYDSDNVVDTTPDKSKKLKLKLIKINSRSKTPKEKKATIKKEENQCNNTCSKSSLTDLLSGISPISKQATNSRKLCLKKPLKRRCSFSPKETSDKKKKVQDIDQSIDDLISYLPPGKEAIKEPLDIKLFKKSKPTATAKKSEEKQEVFDLDETSNDSLLGLLDGSFSQGEKKKENKCDGINFDDSLNLIDVVCEEKPRNTNREFICWKIIEIQEKDYTYENSFTKEERILKLCQVKNDEEQAICHLRDDWFLMELELFDTVYISNVDKTCRQSILDNNSKDFITVFPNTLISGTTIASGITCERQAVLKTRFKTEGQNKIMLTGTLTHEIFQWSIANNKFQIKDIVEKMNELLYQPKFLEIFYQVDTDEIEMASKLKEYLTPIQFWSKNFLSKENYHEKASRPVITEVVDIEENVWSPYLGFKGKVDVSVEVKLHCKPSSKKNLAPLELKTGKMLSTLGSVEHRAQVTVYCLLMGEKYQQPVDNGLLYYFKTNHMQPIPMPAQEKRAIMIKRNDIAHKLTMEKEKQTLPGLLKSKRICSRCPQRQVCMMHYKSRENGEASTSGVEDLYKELLFHLKKEDFQYFRKWYELLLSEAYHETVGNKTRHLWQKSSGNRELRGVCFSNMELYHTDTTSDMKLHYTFKRQKDHFNKQTPLNLIPIIVGDRVIISLENSCVFNETTGYILQVSTEEVVVSVSQKLQKTSGKLYRIDKDETLNNLDIPLTNLANLFQVNSKSDDKLRQSIIHNKKPEFDDKILKINNGIIDRLNKAQQYAISHCLQAKDYVMILGMPGSGKSTTTALLVQSLVSKGKRVLLTSYTHSAVDTILLKLVQNGFTDFIRLGQKQRVHSKIRDYLSQEQTKSFTTTQQMKTFYESHSVFASTCLGVNNATLAKQHFDYCIVDEASQITQPVCIGAVRLADIFILIGDHNQLPPLVQSEKAKTRGMDVSLFKSLSDAHPQAVVTLHYQYRMNKHIMSLSNQLVYQHKMKCGSEAIGNATLSLPHFHTVAIDDQFKSIIDPINPVVFVDTDGRENCVEQIHSKKLVNIGEAVLCRQIVSHLISAGLCGSNIGVICPYRHQLKIIRDEVSTVTSTSNVEVETIDKYQGKDKDCIIVTFVRSNANQEVGELLLDWRRINVALTRAKRKLIMIGSRRTIVGSDVLERLLGIVDEKKWGVSFNDLET